MSNSDVFAATYPYLVLDKSETGPFWSIVFTIHEKGVCNFTMWQKMPHQSS